MAPNTIEGRGNLLFSNFDINSAEINEISSIEGFDDDIAKEIKAATGSINLGVYIQATHGCVENRGVLAHSSLTQTTVLEGRFMEDQSTKK